MRSLLIVSLIALLFPRSTGHHDGGNLVNAVVGNTFSPSTGITEIERIRTHLLGVADRLVRTDVRHLTHAQRKARARNIVRLVEYAHAGRFPHKPASIPGRVPNFLDEGGARCAVGYLLEQDLGLEAVEEVAREHQFDYVPYIDSPVLAAWQAQSGLDAVELAMIQPSYPDRQPPERRAFREHLERDIQALESEGFAGQVVVGRYQDVVFHGAYGFAGWDGREKVYYSTLYDIASVTKAFTALAIYILIDHEKLQLTSTLGELFPGAPKDKRSITVEDLLGHTSGLGNTYAADGETNRAAAVNKLLAQPLASVRGEKFSSSDDGYVILAAVIEVASRTAYEDFLWESGVLNREMTHTAFWGYEQAAPFSRKLDKKLLRPQWGQRGSGGLLTNASDLHSWTVNFLQGYPSEYIVDEITRPRVGTGSGLVAGYGWFWSDPDSHDRVLFTRGNEDFGHNALVASYSNGTVLAVTSNRFDRGEPWSRRVEKELKAFLIETPWPPKQTR